MRANFCSVLIVENLKKRGGNEGTRLFAMFITCFVQKSFRKNGGRQGEIDSKDDVFNYFLSRILIKLKSGFFFKWIDYGLIGKSVSKTVGMDFERIAEVLFKSPAVKE